MKTHTKGNVIVEEIKVGDIHYEFDLGMCIKSEVITLPGKNKNGNWEWQSKNIKDGRIINYMVSTEFPACYAVNLYDYMAYEGCKMI